MVISNPLGMASFPLVPFCNRIRNGRASFGGRAIRVPPNHPAADAPHPLHGIGWLREWRVEHASDARATLSLDVPASDAWPWHFTATQQFTMTPSRLEVAMSMTNLDDAPMPAGIGHHPYFPHEPGTRITARVHAMWHADAQVLPTSLGDSDAVQQLAQGTEVARLNLDNNFTGWQRDALIEWPADRHGPKRALHLRAEAPLDYFVLYSPAGFDHFCAEPVSQCTDWLNLLEQHGRDAVGGTVLQPGESLDARFTLEPEWT